MTLLSYLVGAATAWAATPEAAHVEMQVTGIAALGIDGKALIFQVVNFGILLLVLRLFAYPAVIKMLEGRRQKIEESLKNAELIEREKAALLQEKAKVLDEAHREASRIVEGGETAARTLLEEARGRAGEETKVMAEKAKQQIAQDVVAAKESVRSQVARLTVVVAERVLGEKMDSKKDEALIERALQETT